MRQPQEISGKVPVSEILKILKKTYYKSVPRQIRSLIEGGRREEIFQDALAQYLQDPAACSYPGNSVLQELIYGWGNEAWSAMDEYLAACITQALSTPGPILECGTGLSTVLLGVIAQQRGLSHWGLEHKAEWAQKAQDYLDKYRIKTVICESPLKNFGDYYWYNPPLERMPDSFSLVVCDGPPSRTRGGRFGLIPVMKEKLKSGCVILLDDAERLAELTIAKRWQSQLNLSFCIEGRYKPYINMVVA